MVNAAITPWFCPGTYKKLHFREFRSHIATAQYTGGLRLRPSDGDMRFFAADEIIGIYTDHSSRI